MAGFLLNALIFSGIQAGATLVQQSNIKQKEKRERDRLETLRKNNEKLSQATKDRDMQKQVQDQRSLLTGGRVSTIKTKGSLLTDGLGASAVLGY